MRAAHLLTLLLLVTTGANAQDRSAQDRIARPLALTLGQRAPEEFRARSMDGEALTLRDRPTLIMFFASWCRSCADVLPALPALASRPGVDVLLLSHERRSLIRPHVADLGDTRAGQCTGRTAIRWAARVVPTFVVVSDGEVRYFGQGTSAFDEARDALLATAATATSSPR